MRAYDEVADIVSLVGLRCTPSFAEPLMDDAREKLYFGGWRSSKTTHECLEAQQRIMDWYLDFRLGHGRRRLIWIVGPDYKQTSEEYRYLAEWNQKLGLLGAPPSSALEGPRQLTLKHDVLIETKSADRPETLASVAPDLILCCESGQMSEEVRDMLRGRAGEKNAPIIWGGTVEDDEGHQQWAWYQETARQWLDAPTARHKAWCLPSWENPLFHTCLPWVEEDPELGVHYCVDKDHGEAHGGRNHPVIRQWEDNYDPYTFARRIAAIPTGIQYAVYPTAIAERDKILRPFTPEELAAPIVYGGFGGLDYGTVHPSWMTIGHLIPDERDKQVSFVGPRGILLVKDAWYNEDDPGDAYRLQKGRKMLSIMWGIYNWNVDPNERYLAKSFLGEATSYSVSAREARVGLCTSRLNLGKVVFDKTNPRVVKLYDQICRTHRRKTKDGQLVYVRLDDDGTASWEDMVEACDGKPQLNLPKKTPMRPRTITLPNARRPEYQRRV